MMVERGDGYCAPSEGDGSTGASPQPVARWGSGRRASALPGFSAFLSRRIADPLAADYQGDGSEVAAAKTRLAEVAAEPAARYERWESSEAAQS